MPASASACICARVNHRASWISRPSTSITSDDARAQEPQHQAGGQRPGLVAEVGHLVHHDAGLLRDLASYGVLERLPRLEEAGQRGVPPGRPHVLPSEQQTLVRRSGLATGDGHDHGRVGARELAPAAVDARAARVPPCRTSSRPPQRGQCRVANSHSASPIAWKTSGACSTASPARCGRRPRSPTQSSPSALTRVEDEREPHASVPLAQQHARPLAGRLGRRHPRAPPRRRAAPGCRPRRGPAIPGSAQAASSQALSARRSPTRSWGSAASATCGYLTPGRLVRRAGAVAGQPGHDRVPEDGGHGVPSECGVITKYHLSHRNWVVRPTTTTADASSTRDRVDVTRPPIPGAGHQAGPTSKQIADHARGRRGRREDVERIGDRPDARPPGPRARPPRDEHEQRRASQDDQPASERRAVSQRAQPRVRTVAGDVTPGMLRVAVSRQVADHQAGDDRPQHRKRARGRRSPSPRRSAPSAGRPHGHVGATWSAARKPPRRPRGP